ncbi:hypothetical protein HQ545_06555 [Candidatus Woesearchaeota archaeon]|nr:hypothetical protein [Candidatus Woesearchaeota archaeon]
MGILSWLFGADRKIARTAKQLNVEVEAVNKAKKDLFAIESKPLMQEDKRLNQKLTRQEKKLLSVEHEVVHNVKRHYHFYNRWIRKYGETSGLNLKHQKKALEEMGDVVQSVMDCHHSINHLQMDIRESLKILENKADILEQSIMVEEPVKAEVSVSHTKYPNFVDSMGDVLTEYEGNVLKARAEIDALRKKREEHRRRLQSRKKYPVEHYSKIQQDREFRRFKRKVA